MGDQKDSNIKILRVRGKKEKGIKYRLKQENKKFKKDKKLIVKNNKRK